MIEPQSETPRMDAASNRADDQGQPWANSLLHVLEEGCKLERELTTEHEAKLEYLRRDAERNRQLVDEREARVKAERERDEYKSRAEQFKASVNEVERLTKERDDSLQRLENERQRNIAFCNKFADLKAELTSLRATRVQDHGAAIESAAQNIESAYGLNEARKLREYLRALVATVTNSQQKGGEQREALAAPQPATAKESTVRSSAPSQP